MSAAQGVAEGRVRRLSEPPCATNRPRAGKRAALQTRQSGHERYAGERTCDRQALAGETSWLGFVAQVKS